MPMKKCCRIPTIAEKKINSIALNIIKFRWLIVFATIFFSIASLYLAKDSFEFEGNVQIWFEKDSKVISDYKWFQQTFGNDERVIIAFKDENGIFNEKALSSISRITDFLWETKNIVRADSITNYQYVHVDPEDEDNILIDDFICDPNEMSEQEFAAKKAIATHDVQTKNLLISEDGKTAMIFGRMKKLPADDYDSMFTILDEVRGKLKSEKEITGYDFKIHGNPVIADAYIRSAKADSIFFTPLIYFTAAALLWAMFRRFTGALLPVLVVLFTAILVVSVQAVLGYKFNNFTANIPIFVAAIGIADSVHVYWTWLLARRHGRNNHDAIVMTLSKNFLPAFLTSATTFAGFLSLGISDVLPLKTLGVATASAAILAFLFSGLFMPALLAILNPNIKQNQSFEFDADEEHMPAFAMIYSCFIVTYHKKILLASLAFILFFLAGFAFVKIDTSPIKMFKEHTEIRQNTNFIQENITGPVNFEIVMDSMTNDGIKDPAFMHKVDQFYTEYFEQFSSLRHIASLMDVVKIHHKVLNGDKEEFYFIPDNRDLIAQYLLLYSLSMPQGMELTDQMDIKQRYLRITVQLDMIGSHESMKQITWINEWWDKTEYEVDVHGQLAMYTYMQDNVSSTLIESIILALVLVTSVLFIAFRSTKAMLISLPPNVFPIIIAVGIMGWIGIDVNLSMAISGVIILGVAVDSTIHFLVKYQHARKGQGKSIQESLEYMVTFSGAAIGFTTAILSISFGVFAFSDFVPNVHFGIVTSSALVVALLTNVFMLPALFIWLETRKNVDDSEIYCKARFPNQKKPY
jgi:predicted RND superfamily exporter protein